MEQEQQHAAAAANQEQKKPFSRIQLVKMARFCPVMLSGVRHRAEMQLGTVPYQGECATPEGELERAVGLAGWQDGRVARSGFRRPKAREGGMKASQGQDDQQA